MYIFMFKWDLSEINEYILHYEYVNNSTVKIVKYI